MNKKLWTSKKTGWVLYPGILLFLTTIAYAGNSIKFELKNEDGKTYTQNLWQLLGKELLK